MGKKSRQKQLLNQARQAEAAKTAPAAKPAAPPPAEVKSVSTRFNFDWIGRTGVWFALSIAVIVIGLASMVYKGLTVGQPLNWGIDFTGGTVLTLRLPELAEIDKLGAGQQSAARQKSVAEVREALAKYGLADALIQTAGSDVTVRSRPLTNDERTAISGDLAAKYDAQLIEVDTIGPTVGKQLQRQALWILFFAVILLVGYIAVRFEFSYAIAAILADLHDAFVMIGIASIFNIEINIAFMAALLTIMGYSINDTIIVFDRIRENAKNLRRESFPAVCNLSINQTLNRTMNTVLTTVLAVAAILVFGGATIRPFAWAIFIGLISGTYSSICNASPLLVIFKRWAKAR